MNEYKPNARCKRLVDVDRLRELEGETFGSFVALERAIGWKPYVSGNVLRCDIQRLSHYCQLEFSDKTQRVTIVKVY